MSTVVTTKKQYECVINVLWEFEGGMIGLGSKGHHDPARFREKARDFLCDTSKPYDGAIRESLGGRVDDDEPVLHEWWRYVPVRDYDGGMTMHAEPGSRGAYPVTVLYRY